MDWLGLFKNFYEVVRVKVKCRDHSKIPESRVFEVNGLLFRIEFKVVGPSAGVTQERGSTSNMHTPSPKNHGDDTSHK